MNKEVIFTMGKDEFYPRLITAIQTTKPFEGWFGYKLSLIITNENLELGIVDISVVETQMPFRDLVGYVNMRYYEEEGNIHCFINLKSLGPGYKKTVNGMLEEVLQKIQSL